MAVPGIRSSTIAGSSIVHHNTDQDTNPALLAALRGDFETADRLLPLTIYNPNTVDGLLARAKFYEDHHLVIGTLRSYEAANFLLVEAVQQIGQCRYREWDCYYQYGGIKIRDGILRIIPQAPYAEQLFLNIYGYNARHLRSSSGE